MNDYDRTKVAGRLGSMAAKQAKGRWGAGWSLLSNEQRSGAIAREFVAIIAGQMVVEGSEPAQLKRLLEEATAVIRM